MTPRTAIVLLALCLLFAPAPAAADEQVQAPNEDGPCTAVKIYTDEPRADVHPECIGDAPSSSP